MTLTQIEYILALAQHKNFRKAAQACHVTQPTLSIQVQKLEEELGVSVFDRNQSPIRITRLGEKIIEQSRITLTEAKRLKDIILKDQEMVKGELTVGIIPTIAPYLIPFFLSRFVREYPKVNLNLVEMTTENCLKALDKERIDVAILATKENRKLYQQEKIFSEELMLYVNSEHLFNQRKSISPEDLEIKDIWLLEEGHCLKDEILKVCRLKKMKNSNPVSLKIGSLEALRYLVEEDRGYTLLPYLSTLKLKETNKAKIKNLEGRPTRPIMMTVRKGGLKHSIVSALRDEIVLSLPM